MLQHELVPAVAQDLDVPLGVGPGAPFPDERPVRSGQGGAELTIAGGDDLPPPWLGDLSQTCQRRTMNADGALLVLIGRRNAQRGVLRVAIAAQRPAAELVHGAAVRNDLRARATPLPGLAAARGCLERPRRLGRLACRAAAHGCDWPQLQLAASRTFCTAGDGRFSVGM